MTYPPPMPQAQNQNQNHRNLEELPTEYQFEDIRQVFRILQAGESIALVGIGSSGKSNFAKHLVRRDVKYYHFANQGIRERKPHQLMMVLLNPHQIIHLEESALKHSGRMWPGYELMLNRLRHALRDLHDEQLEPHEAAALGEIERSVQTAYRNMFHKSPLMVQSTIRRLEDAVEMVLALGDEWQLVFIFDELEEYLRVLPVEFFQSLRGIRDDHKRRVMYITTSRHSPAELLLEKQSKRERMVLEGFTELFHDFTNYLRPLDEASTEYNMQRFRQRFGAAINPVQKEYLKYATGQHMGLMRRGYIAACNTNVGGMSMEQFAEFLLSSEKVKKDCGSIYESLTEPEKDAMAHLSFGPVELPPELWQQLYNKHLIGQNSVIRIPVLAAYIRRLYTQPAT